MKKGTIRIKLMVNIKVKIKIKEKKRIIHTMAIIIEMKI
jgi:hypothetical protein